VIEVEKNKKTDIYEEFGQFLQQEGTYGESQYLLKRI